MSVDIHKECSTNCWGQKGYDGSCCTIENRDYIIGSIDEESQKRLLMNNKHLSWNDMFITYEEGRKMYPNKPILQDKTWYPAMRLQNDERNSCIFYKNKSCSVYDIRPTVCKEFFCDHLKELKAKESENG